MLMLIREEGKLFKFSNNKSYLSYMLIIQTISMKRLKRIEFNSTKNLLGLKCCNGIWYHLFWMCIIIVQFESVYGIRHRMKYVFLSSFPYLPHTFILVFVHIHISFTFVLCLTQETVSMFSFVWFVQDDLRPLFKFYNMEYVWVTQKIVHKFVRFYWSWSAENILTIIMHSDIF